MHASHQQPRLCAQLVLRHVVRGRERQLGAEGDVPRLRPLDGRQRSGLALLAALSPQEAQAILDRSRPRLAQKCLFSHAQLLAETAQARNKHYWFGKDLVIKGVSAVGVVVPSSLGAPSMAIRVSGVHSRVTMQRLPEILPMLRQTAARIRAASAQG